MRTGGILICVSFVGLAGWAAGNNENRWHIPSTGAVYDPVAKAIRPITGLLGAARLGTSIRAAEWASVSPGGQRAIASDQGLLRWIPDLGSPDTVHEMPDAEPAGEAYWAANGETVLLVHPGSGSLSWWQSKDDAPPELKGQVARPAGAEEWKIIGVSSDLQFVALATRSHNGEGTWHLLISKGMAEPLTRQVAGQPVCAAFSSNGDRIYYAESGHRRVHSLDWSDESAEAQVLIDAGEDAWEPAGLTLSPTGKSLAVLLRNPGKLQLHSLTDGALQLELPLDEEPDGFTSLSPGRFGLNRRKEVHQPVIVLDWTGEPKVLFVPAGE